ncbi:MAG: hypothetical protein C3F07_03415 [Anaerolineales bacterium]|nr:hypothetical protein [Anaerolineae bacterium]PWB76645.1 MAG: hypothetical protein C3F07_03415 [Anaerolineales bacterium]
MNTITRTTRACTLETLNSDLRAAMHTHAKRYNLTDLESDVLLCCETTSIRQKSGLFAGIVTTLSAVFVTPKWLVWADSTDQNDAEVGSAQLKHIDVRDYRDTARFTISPDQGLNITGRYTDKNKTGITFIVLGSDPDGQNFRQVLKAAMDKAA